MVDLLKWTSVLFAISLILVSERLYLKVTDFIGIFASITCL